MNVCLIDNAVIYEEEMWKISRSPTGVLILVYWHYLFISTAKMKATQSKSKVSIFHSFSLSPLHHNSG